MGRELSLADGQLAASASTLISGSDVGTGFVSIVLANTSTVEQTVVLTFSRAGGTARRLARAVLAEGDQLIVNNLPMQGDDVVQGYATVANNVDYVVYSATSGESVTITAIDASGNPRTESAGTIEFSGTLDVSKSAELADLMTEQNSILRRMLLALQMTLSFEVPDPA